LGVRWDVRPAVAGPFWLVARASSVSRFHPGLDALAGKVSC
jgi:hypothetical protein